MVQLNCCSWITAPHKAMQYKSATQHVMLWNTNAGLKKKKTR